MFSRSRFGIPAKSFVLQVSSTASQTAAVTRWRYQRPTTRRSEEPKDLGGVRRHLLGERNNAFIQEKCTADGELLGSTRAA
jgi:hypothetical protein